MSGIFFTKYYLEIVQQAKKDWHSIRENQKIPFYFSSFLLEELELTLTEIDRLQEIAQINGYNDSFSICYLPSDRLLFDDWLYFSQNRWDLYNLQQFGSFFTFVQKLKDYVNKNYVVSFEIKEIKKEPISHYYKICNLI